MIMIFNKSIIPDLFLITKFLIFNLFLINMFFATEIECCFFCQRTNYSDREYIKGNIALFFTNQAADVLYVSNKSEYLYFRKKVFFPKLFQAF